jgi:hypothetical protein
VHMLRLGGRGDGHVTGLALAGHGAP